MSKIAFATFFRSLPRCKNYTKKNVKFSLIKELKSINSLLILTIGERENERER